MGCGLFYEQLEPGATFTTRQATVTEDAIVGFASEWDPQSFHLSREAAAGSLFGRLVGSGLHTLLLSYRLYYDLGLPEGTALAGLGIDEVRFLGPLEPGDTIKVRIAVVEKRRTRTHARGIARFRFETENQRGDVILSYVLTALVASAHVGLPQNSDI